MFKSSFILLIIVACILMACAKANDPVGAAATLSLSVESVVEDDNHNAVITWNANNEVGCDGYNVLRALSSNYYTARKINSILIACDQNGTYTYADTDTEISEKYYYWVEGIADGITYTSSFKSLYMMDGDTLMIAQAYPAVGEVLHITTSDDYVVTAEDECGISIFNKDSGALIYHGAEYNNGSYLQETREVSLLDTVLFIYNSNGAQRKFTMLSVADPTNPVFMGNHTGDTPSVSAFHIKENNLNNSEYPVVAFPYFATYLNNNSQTVQLEGHYVFGATGTFINVLGVERHDAGRLTDFYSEGDRYYITAQQAGLLVMDIIYENNQFSTDYVDVASINTPGRALALTYHDNYLYIADRQAGLQVVNISDRDNPQLLPASARSTSGYAQSLDADGNWLIIASGGGGVYLFDITDREDPMLIDRLDISEVGYAYGAYFDELTNDIFVSSRDMGALRLTINVDAPTVR